MSSANRLSYLLESVFVPNNTGVTIALIESTLSEMPGAADAVLATFLAAQQPAEMTVAGLAKAGRMQSAFIAMSSDTGLSLATPDRQATIDELALAGSWPDVVRDAIKALGGTFQPRWQTEGYPSEPTLEQIDQELQMEAIKEEARQKFLLIGQLRKKWNNIAGFITNQIETGQMSTIQEILSNVESEWSN